MFRGRFGVILSVFLDFKRFLHFKLFLRINKKKSSFLARILPKKKFFIMEYAVEKRSSIGIFLVFSYDDNQKYHYNVAFRINSCEIRPDHKKYLEISILIRT